MAQAPLVEGDQKRSDSDNVRSFTIRSNSKSISLRVPIRGRHSLNFSAEYFRQSSLPQDFSRAAGIKPDWNFYAVPFTVSYTYAFPSIGKRVHPIVGAGITGMAYRISQRQEEGTAFNPFEASVLFVPRNETGHSSGAGVGYGSEAFVGFRTDINETIYFLTQVRYRYLCGKSLSGQTQHNANLNIIDFSIGIGFTLR